MPENDYATKQDVAEVRNRLDGIDHRMEHMEQRLIEQMRDMQTEVLRAFHNWAGPTDIKLRSHEERITLLEDRLMQLERGDKIH